MGSRRADGRREQQFRNLHFQMGVDHTVDGSCLYKQGLTEVIALVEGPRAKTQQECLIIEYSMSPFSNMESKRSSKFDKEYSMFAENLKSSFLNLILMDQNGKSEIKISVCVIQNDGSAKSAVFNAVTIALLDAGVQMRDFLVSLTVGLCEGRYVIDLTQEECKSAQGELTLSFQHREQRIDYFELKTLKLASAELGQLTKLAVSKASELYQQIRNEVYEMKSKVS